MKEFTIESPKNGRLYRLSAQEVPAFYEEHVLGSARRLREKVLRRLPVFPNPLPMVGTVLLELFTGTGELAEVRMGPNLIVTTGRELVIDRLQAAAVAVPDYLAIGTGATAPAAGNTTLETEMGTRVQGTLSQPTSTTDRCVGTFAAGNGTGAITECGRLNAATAGALVGRQTFAVINKGALDSLQITYDITD